MNGQLCNPAAIASARDLYRTLCSRFGRYIFLAQQESPRRNGHDDEMTWIRSLTGQLPAIRGLDFIHDDYDGVVDRARRWHEEGGIVTICWHTGVDGIGYPDSQRETPDIEALLFPGTPAHDQWMRRLENTSRALERLQQANVPVLWRPYHEFDGRWFWWGKQGAAAFRRLWRMTWNVMTRDFGLNHLIWVLGYADDVDGRWYPGDDVVDIVGSDTYKGVTTHATAWRKLRAAHPGKIAAFHECGQLPPPDQFFREGAAWAWLMPWHGRWLMEDNAQARLKEIYHDSRFITRKQYINEEVES